MRGVCAGYRDGGEVGCVGGKVLGVVNSPRDHVPLFPRRIVRNPPLKVIGLDLYVYILQMHSKSVRE